MSTRLIAATVLLSSLAGLAPAHEPQPSDLIPVGSRVRLRTGVLSGQPRGIVAAVDDTTLTLSTESGGPLRIPIASISSLETSLSKRRSWLRGLAAGASGGFLLGFAFNVDPDDCERRTSDNFCSRGEALAGSTLTFGLIGLGVGSLIKSDRWSVVTLTRPTAAGRRALPGAYVSFRF